MIKDLDTVALTHDIPEHGLRQGDLGAIVFVWRDDEVFEVEFVSLTGDTITLTTLKAADLRPIGTREIAHARVIA